MKVLAMFVVTLAVIVAMVSSQDIEDDKNTTTTVSSTTLSTSTGAAENTTTSGPTTAVTPTHMPSPTPAPEEPAKHKWHVTDAKNNTCILLEAGIRLIFQYKNSSGQIVKNHILDVPANEGETEAVGMCGKEDQEITLKFFDDWNITLYFKLNSTEQKYDIAKITYNYTITPVHFKVNDSEGTVTGKHDVKEFETEAKKKYMCVARQHLYKQLNETVLGLAEINTYSLQFEAFRTSETQDFTNSATRCKSDEVSQLVPIIVGSVLAGLIVIVLVAYLIGRRRSRRGYESV